MSRDTVSLFGGFLEPANLRISRIKPQKQTLYAHSAMECFRNGPFVAQNHFYAIVTIAMQSPRLIEAGKQFF